MNNHLLCYGRKKFMPISIDYDRKENVIYFKAEGVIKFDDILFYFSTVGSFDLEKGYRVFADFSDASLELSSKDIQNMAYRRNAMLDTNDKIMIAVFCKSDLVFGMGRMYEILLGEKNCKVEIFRKKEEALTWLNI